MIRFEAKTDGEDGVNVEVVEEKATMIELAAIAKAAHDMTKDYLKIALIKELEEQDDKRN